MEEKIINLRKEIEQKRSELDSLWIDYVKTHGEIPLGGCFISLHGGFAEPMVRMSYRDNDIIFEEESGEENSFLGCKDERTVKDMEYAVFGCC